jgi:hypothetical protein
VAVFWLESHSIPFTQPIEIEYLHFQPVEKRCDPFLLHHRLKGHFGTDLFAKKEGIAAKKHLAIQARLSFG